MKAVIPLLLTLAACDSGVKGELAAIRQELQEVKKINQPKLEAVDAMDDLAREVKRLREKIHAPVPVLAPSPAPVVVPAPAAGTAGLMGGVGGTQPGISDVYWVLAKVTVDAQERTVLCMYRAQQPGKGFQLEDVRVLSYDMQIVELNARNHSPSVADVMKALKK